MRRSLADIGRVLADLRSQAVQVVQYNKHHPLAFALEELIRMADGMARDIAELQRRTETASARRDAEVRDAEARMSRLAAGQARDRGTVD